MRSTLVVSQDSLRSRSARRDASNLKNERKSSSGHFKNLIFVSTQQVYSLTQRREGAENPEIRRVRKGIAADTSCEVARGARRAQGRASCSPDYAEAKSKNV